MPGRGVRDPDAWSRMPWGNGGDDAGGRILPDISPMSVCPGEVFDAGGGPLCDMDADVERGVVPRDDKYILRPVRLPVRMRCRGPSFRFLYGGLKVRWRKF